VNPSGHAVQTRKKVKSGGCEVKYHPGKVGAEQETRDGIWKSGHQDQVFICDHAKPVFPPCALVSPSAQFSLHARWPLRTFLPWIVIDLQRDGEEMRVPPACLQVTAVGLEWSCPSRPPLPSSGVSCYPGFVLEIESW
jgi:hypothetical protein